MTIRNAYRWGAVFAITVAAVTALLDNFEIATYAMAMAAYFRATASDDLKP